MKVNAFLAVGATAMFFVAGMQVEKLLSHEQIKENISIMTPKIINSTTNIQTNNAETNVYESWSNENLKLLKTLDNDTSVLNKLNKLSINFNDDLKNELTHTNDYQKYRININIEKLNEVDYPANTRLYQIFNNNKQKVFDYIYFNQVSNFITATHKEDTNFPEVLKAINREIPDNIEYHDRIFSQYNQSIARVMTIQLLFKKYPELVKDEKLIYELAKVNKVEEPYASYSSIALIQFDKEFKGKSSTLPNNLKDILNVGREYALYQAKFNTNRPEYIYYKDGHSEPIWPDIRYKDSRDDFQKLCYDARQYEIDYNYAIEKYNDRKQYKIEMAKRNTIY